MPRFWREADESVTPVLLRIVRHLSDNEVDLFPKVYLRLLISYLKQIAAHLRTAGGIRPRTRHITYIGAGPATCSEKD